MNRYHDAMAHCAPPPELEARLREAVLSAKPEAQSHPAVYRPRGFFRKALLAAILAVVLTLSVGAAVLVNWDTIFSDRFGPEGAETPMAEKAFQPVHVTSVCDDVTLTIREALVDEKSLYLILDYQLPDTVDRELVETTYNSYDWPINAIDLPDVSLYLTEDVSWEAFKAADQDRWAALDWTGRPSDSEMVSEPTLVDTKRRSSGSMYIESQGYDRDTNTLTYLYSATVTSADLDFTAQPLTLVVTPPILWTDGTPQALANHPALVSFQPNTTAQTLRGSLRQDDRQIEVTLSPFAINLEISGVLPDQDLENWKQNTALVLRDGSLLPVSLVSGSSGGSESHGDTRSSCRFTSLFLQLLDVSQVTAVQVDGMTIPLE